MEDIVENTTQGLSRKHLIAIIFCITLKFTFTRSLLVIGNESKLLHTELSVDRIQ